MPSIKSFAVTAAIVVVVMFAMTRFAPAAMKKATGIAG